MSVRALTPAPAAHISCLENGRRSREALDIEPPALRRSNRKCGQETAVPDILPLLLQKTGGEQALRNGKEARGDAWRRARVRFTDGVNEDDRESDRKHGPNRCV
ncbi:hypothetical protein Q8A67_014088 [Cirrhinus molitorella]|uniref:Uncharacterized protein n=1 Tax=Cirrhinus molitorella TaxID=172907 RepID=A0AA88PJR5_9TELE|nr:hypothetical protein Q8A67_014088 [Cirrhinus molitorella]